MTYKLIILAIAVLVVVLGVAVYICLIGDAYAVPCQPYPQCLGIPPKPPLGPGIHPINPPICVGCGCSGGYFDEKWVNFNLPPRAAYRKVRFFVRPYYTSCSEYMKIFNKDNQILWEGYIINIIWATDFIPTDVARLWIWPCGRWPNGDECGWIMFDSLEIIETQPENMLKPSTSSLKFELYENHPNPFNPETEISYDLPKDSWVKLSIYNIGGQKVKMLVDGFESAGHKTVIWDGRNEQGELTASGVYFYRLEAGEFTATKKMVILR
jgi:hypothetical protein